MTRREISGEFLIGELSGFAVPDDSVGHHRWKRQGIAKSKIAVTAAPEQFRIERARNQFCATFLFQFGQTAGVIEMSVAV